MENLKSPSSDVLEPGAGPEEQQQPQETGQSEKPSPQPNTSEDPNTSSPDILEPGPEQQQQPQETSQTEKPTRRSNMSSHKRQRSQSFSDGEISEDSESAARAASENPPLPDEEAPPLPDEAPPEDDGWGPVWEPNVQAYYFYNRFTQATQWENPRVPASPATGLGGAPGTTGDYWGAPATSSPRKSHYGGYNPAIHGDYDPNADYAQVADREEEEQAAAAAAAAAGYAGYQQDPNAQYTATAQFNRFTGRFQAPDLNPEKYNDENKSRRQLSAFFDVDAAANSHDGRSLKAERQAKKLTKQQVKEYREKKRAKKEEKRRAWLRD
ncbi:hypothetical protein GQ43DRAFT_439553 [Delitschia confertaspora ATCC 74209]|uniref:WW domain-containing protein n=1 Tax=Delitschia confertaspora ATCC 74209 TaxID=1513339 RepID=A0A9P4JP29_9PLEO|nr:hypothetical protein GQ43DRAFT_439553 [Delitschia confertaspora ATCC 74209]